MDGPRFDELARVIGSGQSRRRVLKVISGGIFGLAAGGFATRSVSAGTGGYGDPCDADEQCDSSQTLTCDESRSKCRGDVGFPCFDTEDCSTSDGFLCVDENGTECASDEAECGTCGVQASECLAEGEVCETDDDCCDGLYCPSDQLDCTVIPTADHATITIHKATCPEGVGSDIFEQCHGNTLGGVSFDINGFEIGSGTITTDSGGVASATILEAAQSGGITITEDPDVLAGYLGAYVFCSEQNSGDVFYDGNAPGGSISFNGSQGDDILCDWYNIMAAGAEPTAVPTSTSGGTTELPNTGAGDSDSDVGRALAGLGAVGAVALMLGKKLRLRPGSHS